MSMPPVGFETTISVGERPQTYALDPAATGIGHILLVVVRKPKRLRLVGYEYTILFDILQIPIKKMAFPSHDPAYKGSYQIKKKNTIFQDF